MTNKEKKSLRCWCCQQAAATREPNDLGGKTSKRACPSTDNSPDRLEDVTLYTFDLTDGAVLEKGHCYVIPLLEHIDEPLPKGQSSAIATARTTANSSKADVTRNERNRDTRN